MTTAERIIAAVALCAHHNATVRFRRDAVRVVPEQERCSRCGSLL